MSRNVVIVNANYPHYEVEKAVLAPYEANVLHVSTGASLEKTIEAVRYADAVMTRETRLPAELIEALERCKVIVRYGVGVDNIDLKAAAKRHIYVANVGDYGTEVVAEHAVALMFAAARRIVSRDRGVRHGAWDVGAKEPMYSFVGKTLGLIGCGKIGKAFLKKVSCLGFSRILVYDPYLKNAEKDWELIRQLDDVLRQADVVSLHMPLTSETYHAVDARRLALMKPTAILVNASRGGLVDETALADALLNGRLFAAGIDTFEQEPPSLDNPLLQLDNTVVSDHTGWYAVESLERLQRKAAEEVARVFSGEEPISWVNCWKE